MRSESFLTLSVKSSGIGLRLSLKGKIKQTIPMSIVKTFLYSEYGVRVM